MSNIVNQTAKDKRVLGAAVTTIETRANALTPDQLRRLGKVVAEQFDNLVASVTKEGE